MGLIEQMLASLGLDEYSQRVAAANDQEAERQSLEKVMGFLLSDDMRGEGMEDFKLGGLPGGPPGWLKGVIQGGGKAARGLLGNASTRELHRALRKNVDHVVGSPNMDPGLYRSMQDAGNEMGDILVNRREAAFENMGRWEEIGDEAVARYAKLADEYKAKANFPEEAARIQSQMDETSDVLDRAHKMNQLLIDSDSMRGRHIRESAGGFDLSNARPGEELSKIDDWAQKNPGKNPLGVDSPSDYIDLPGRDVDKILSEFSEQELGEKVFREIIPQLNDSQVGRVNSLLKSPDMTNKEALELIYLEFSDLVDPFI